LPTNCVEHMNKIKTLLHLSCCISLSCVFASAQSQSNQIDSVSQQSDNGEVQYLKAIQLNNSKKYFEASILLKKLMLAYPEIERYRSDYILVAANANQCNDVLALNSDAYFKSAPQYVQNAILRCQENVAINEQYSNLLKSQNAVAKSKNNKEAKKKVVMDLAEMGLAQLSIDEIESDDESYSQIERLKLRSKSGNQDIEYWEANSGLYIDRYENVDKGIAKLEKALEYGISINAPQENLDEIRGYLIRGYEKRRYWDKAVNLYVELNLRQAKLTDLTRYSAAISYLELHEYKDAELIFQSLANENPKINTIFIAEVYLGLYSSILGQNRFPEAHELLLRTRSELDALAKTNVEAKPLYTQTYVEEVYEKAYQDKNAEAAEMADMLLSDIPQNVDLLNAAGHVSSWQLSPRRAENYFKTGLGIAPLNIDGRIGLAQARMDQGDIKYFQNTVNELRPYYSDLQPVKEAGENLDIYQRPYIAGNFEWGNGGPNAAGVNNYVIGDVRAYSSPISDNYRLFALYRGLYTWSGATLNTTSVGAGIRYEGIDRIIELAVADQGYAGVEATQVLSDRWSVNAIYERNAWFLQPGSLTINQATNLANLNLRWHNNDTTEGFVGYRYSTFSGNVKQEVFAELSQRLLTAYNYRLDLSGYFGNQQNSSQDVAYFSPINQNELSATLTLRILQWEDIKTKQYKFWHKLWGTYGGVTQTGFSTLPMSNYGYGQEFEIGKGRTLSWGVQKTTFPFDGVQSSFLTGYLQFQGQF